MWGGDLDPKAAPDFFRESPWKVEAISGPRKRWMLKKILEIARQLGIELVILIGIDDSLGISIDTRKWSTHIHPPCANGYVYVEVHIQIGPLGFLFDARLYQREKMGRQLNRG